MSYPVQKHIKSARLHLSAMTSSARELYQTLYVDPVTMQYIGPCYNKEQSAVFFKNCLKKTENPDSGWHFYSIQLIEQTESIGFISLIAKPFLEAPYEFGIMLKATARGLGYADEALTALFLHCFIEAKVPALLACVDPRNPGMMKHIKHFGFVDAPAALKKSAELNSYLIHASADNISYLRTLGQQFSEQQFDKPQPALA